MSTQLSFLSHLVRMSQKLVCLQNGVFKKKELTPGLQYYNSNNQFITAPMPATEGNYVISYQNGNLTLSQQPAALQSLNSTHFQTGGGALSVASSGTIPYFTSPSTFGSLDIPSTTGIHVLHVDSTSKSFTTLTPAHIFKDTLKTFGVIDNPAIPLWNGVTASSLKLPSAGSWYLQKDSTGWNWVTMSGHNIMRLCWGLDNTKKQIVTFEQGSARSIILPSDQGKYLLNVSSNGASFVATTNSGSKTFKSIHYTTGKNNTLVSCNLSGQTNDNMITSDNLSIEIGKQYFMTVDMELVCSDYESVLDGFGSGNEPLVGVCYGSNRANIDYVIQSNVIANPLPFIHISGNGIFTADNVRFVLGLERSGSTSISHKIKRLVVRLLEL